MKRNWEYKKLGDVCTIVGRIGFRGYKRSDYVEGLNDGAISLSPSNINNGVLDYSKCTFISWEKYKESPEIMIENGDVLLVKTASVGKSAYVEHLPHETTINPQFVVLKHISANHKYIAYVVKSNSFLLDLKSITFGSSVPTLSQKDLADLSIPVPSLSEQSRIVAELDLLTGIIDKQNAQLKELDNLAQAIFYDMFGDPIENPKGWEVKKLGDVSTSVSYGTSSPSSTVGKYKHLRMNNITYEGFLDLTDLKYIDMDDAEFEKYSVREGDVLFNRTNSMDLIGKTTYIHNMEPMIIAGYIIRVRLVDSVLPVYVSKFMNMPAMKKKLKGMAKGAVNQANINSKELKSIDIPLPPLALQQSFAEKIQSIEKQKETIRASIADTQKLLDYTMDKYFG